MTVDERLAEIEKLVAFDFHTFGHDETCPGCKKKWLVDELKRTRAAVREELDYLASGDPAAVLREIGQPTVLLMMATMIENCQAGLRAILDGGDQ